MQHKNFGRFIFWGIVASCIVNIIGWFVTLHEGEASRLAATTARILHNYRQSGLLEGIISNAGEAPFTLWVSGIFMAILGPNHIAYRIPGFLAMIFCLFSVNRLARIYCTPGVSKLATLITATLQSTFILNENVNPDTYATAFYTFTIWQLAACLRDKRLQNFILTLLGLALVIISKGTLDDTSSRFTPFSLSIILLWSFSPWTIFLILGIWQQLKAAWKDKRGKNAAYRSLPLYALLAPFILLSLNPYQTTTDAFLLYPLGAIFAAEYISRTFYEQPAPVFAKKIYIIQVVLCYLALALLFWIVWYPFSDNNYYGLIHYMGMLSIFTWLVFFSSFRNKLLICCIVIAIGGNLVLNSYYYPNLSRYQAGSTLGLLAKTDGVEDNRLFSYQAGAPYTLEFYSGVRIRETGDFRKLIAQKNCWVYTHQHLLEEFRALRPDLRILGSSNDFPFSGVNITFLNPNSRNQVISRKILLKL
ncbi:ArnT family glycosyltransferase [Dyadobacter aurulentus]|uniref:ArnT family glycosyltransferase n=1 Tax=Dyadobacter sp. UC 10 TaxID=2605428 RepID=UPI001788C5B9|nr:glycosyltransferase family 39 protein [Dyadobacter sp. UC 10]